MIHPRPLPLVRPFALGVVDVPGEGAQIVIVAGLEEGWQASAGLGRLFPRMRARDDVHQTLITLS